MLLISTDIILTFAQFILALVKYATTRERDQLLNASYYRQLYVKIKMKSYKIKSVLLDKRGRRYGLIKLVLILIFFNIRGKILQYGAIHDFSVWLRTSSNPTDINRFRRQTGRVIISFSNKLLGKNIQFFIFMQSTFFSTILALIK